MDFAKKVAVVTGGSRGIGLAAARAMATAGMNVVLTGRNAERGAAAERAIHEAGGRARYVQADMSRDEDVHTVFQRVRSEFGRLDFLFNNAGSPGAGFGDFLLTTAEECDELMSSNIKGVFHSIQHALPLMLESGGGVIINNASPIGNAYFSPLVFFYGATQAAVVAMTRTIAEGYRDRGITAYAVCPFMTDTPLLDAGVPREFIASLNPSGKLNQPEDVAAVVMSILNGTGSYKNGDVVLIDGGRTQKLAAPAVL